MANKDYTWDASEFFKDLTERNRLAKDNGFVFCRVSGLDGFEEALVNMQNSQAFVCVSELSQGYTSLSPSPRTRMVKTVFIALRHPVDDMQRRQACFDTLRELFRQFMTVLIKEKTALEEHYLYVDPRISFNEMEEYFFSGCACAFFSIAIDKMTDLCYDSDEWEE